MSMLRDFLDLPRVVTPYVFHPLVAAEVFFPHARPVTWFTQSKSFVPAIDVSPLHGKVILVTGGNAGLGKESIYQLALSRPAKIYLAARSRAKGEAAIQDVFKHLSKNGSEPFCNIEYLELDLCNLHSVRDAAQTVLSQETRLDILMLNAGIMATPPSKSQSGHDAQLCTNHIGHFLLSMLLLPLMEQTAFRSADSDVRVVTLSSEAHHIAPSNFLNMIESHDQLCSASPFVAYGVSKAANILFAAELARRCNGKRIISVSLHPGLILTDLYLPNSKANFLVRFGLPPLARWFFDDVKHGALNQIWCAVGAERDQLVNGAYYTPVGRLQRSFLVEDEVAGSRLWDWTKRQLSAYLDPGTNAMI